MRRAGAESLFRTACARGLRRCSPEAVTSNRGAKRDATIFAIAIDAIAAQRPITVQSQKESRRISPASGRGG